MNRTWTIIQFVDNLGYSKDCLIIIGVDSSGILGDADANPQGLVDLPM